jgi:HSP20 family protein
MNKEVVSMWRNSIWDEMARMQEDMDALFDGYIAREEDILCLPECLCLSRAKAKASSSLFLSDYRKPLADIYETDKEFVSVMEMPGVSKEDIRINLTEDAIEVKVEKKAEKKEEDKKKGIYRMERRYAGFYRCLGLPKNVEADKISASYKDGVLELRMPKAEPKDSKLKEIRVN